MARFPLGNYLHSASSAEAKLAETTLATIRVGRSYHAVRSRQKPARVIAWPSAAAPQAAMDCLTHQLAWLENFGAWPCATTARSPSVAHSLISLVS